MRAEVDWLTTEAGINGMWRHLNQRFEIELSAVIAIRFSGVPSACSVVTHAQAKQGAYHTSCHNYHRHLCLRRGHSLWRQHYLQSNTFVGLIFLWLTSECSLMLRGYFYAFRLLLNCLLNLNKTFWIMKKTHFQLTNNTIQSKLRNI